MITIAFLWILIIILLFVFIKLLNIEKNFLISFLISIFTVIFIVNIEISIDSALLGLNLVVKTILPTIFPFAVICNLIINYDGISLYSKILGPLICKPLNLSKVSSFPIVASMISGYPLGCKYCCDLYEEKYIDKFEFQRLLNIASNASPMFIIGSIGVGMLGNPKLGFILLFANYLSPLIVGFFTRYKYSSKSSKPFISKNKNINLGEALKISISNGINTTLQVSAFVVLFSIIIGIIKNNTFVSIVFQNLELLFNLPVNSLYGTFLGSIEFTNGCNLISQIPTLSIPLKLSIISFICSFSGLSIIGQISSFVGQYNISMRKYIFWKLIQGFLSFLITFSISYFFIDSIQASTYISYNYILFNKLYLFLISILLIPLLIRITCALIQKYFPL